MAKYRVMLVMPVSIVVEVDATSPEEAIEAAETECPGHNSMGCGWDSADAPAFDDQDQPYMVERVG